jgi:hypothetical protein
MSSSDPDFWKNLKAQLFPADYWNNLQVQLLMKINRDLDDRIQFLQAQNTKLEEMISNNGQEAESISNPSSGEQQPSNST